LATALPSTVTFRGVHIGAQIDEGHAAQVLLRRRDELRRGDDGLAFGVVVLS
jgi:hypothetical protein